MKVENIGEWQESTELQELRAENARLRKALLGIARPTDDTLNLLEEDGWKPFARRLEEIAAEALADCDRIVEGR